MVNSNNCIGFTLIELVIVMVIVSVLAAIAIPSFNNNMVTSKEQSIENILRGIGASESKLFEDKGTYYTSPGAAQDFYNINSNLSMSMEYVNDGFIYTCQTAGSTSLITCPATNPLCTFTCSAANGNYPKAPGITITIDADGTLTCSTGQCP